MTASHHRHDPRCDFDSSGRISAHARAIYRFEVAGRRLTLHFAAAIGLDGSPPPVELPSRWSIVTAWNPGPIVLDDAVNAARHEQLAACVSQLGLRTWPSVASDSRGEHAEPGLFVASITRTQTLELARAFGQAAAVHGVHARAGVLYTASERWIMLPARWSCQ